MLRTNSDLLTYVESLKKKAPESVALRKFAKGATLLHQGEKALKVLVVRQGITKCFFREENGKEYIVEFLGKGEILGDIEAIRGIDCLCSIETLEETEAYVFSIPFFRSILSTDLQLNNLLLNAFAERIVNTSSRASFQQLYSTEHSLAKLLDLQIKQRISITKEDMAAYLGITVRSLNRVLERRK